jgi:hypothetical protein
MARQGFANVQFEVVSDEDLKLLRSFTWKNPEVEQQPIDSGSKTKSKLNQDNGFVQDMQEGLQRSVRAVN